MCHWGLPVARPVATVEWKRYSLTRATMDRNGDLWNICVYVIADPAGRPLYIGRATGEKYRGFGERYVGNAGSIAAIAHGSRNWLYLGRRKGAQLRTWHKNLERELI